jgi:hypothetical protein
VTTGDGLNVTGALQVQGTNVMNEIAGKSGTNTVAALDIRVTGVETGKVDKTDARYLASLTNAAAFATAATLAISWALRLSF